MYKIQTTDVWIETDSHILNEGIQFVSTGKKVIKKEGVIVLTEAEYLADKKKTAEEAFDAGRIFGMDLCASNENCDDPTMPDKDEYLKSLLP